LVFAPSRETLLQRFSRSRAAPPSTKIVAAGWRGSIVVRFPGWGSDLDQTGELAPPALEAGASAPVAIIMGSRSDWPTLRAAADALTGLGIGYAAKVVSAHRTPERLYAFARGAQAEGFKVIIAGAGGAAHLPGMTASMTELPVLGVPVRSEALSGLDSLLSIVQMPSGVPTATFAIGKSGAHNAGLFAAQILALSDPALAARLADFRAAQTAAVAETVEDL
jgi:5-(carboxyamino)imidazole ribonucleotide mutase